jgi:two-component system sensor histidine kinase UhpB
VSLAYLDNELRIEVRDDGSGFDPSRARAGLGLAGIHERMELLGGTFDLTSQPGQGTVVAVSLPVAAVVTPAPHAVLV